MKTKKLREEFKVFYLVPTNGQKSFGNKAIVIIEGGFSKLKSYNTIVATYNHATKEIKINGWYSLTTQKHINSFLELYGFETMNKNDYKKQNLL